LETISKKELLELTGISYGQLYRWKREGLIPEEWFMKQSSYTGQETFFPREQMVSRVRSILELKDDYSLDELSRILDPDIAACIYREDLDLIKEIDKMVLDQSLLLVKQERFRLTDVAFLIMLSQVAARNQWTWPQVEELLVGTLPGVLERTPGEYRCTFFAIADRCHLALCRVEGGLMFDKGIAVVETVDIEPILSTIKVNYNHLFHGK
jgi:DNA-binding transcriptional MerR regulator